MTSHTDIRKAIREEAIETVRFVFPDQHGVLRGKALVASAAEKAFETGITVPSSLILKDTSHRTAFPVWSGNAAPGDGRLEGAGDMLLKPLPETFRKLPWSPHSAWILCQARFRDDSPMPFDPVTVLHNALSQLAEHQFDLMIGLEVEFHVYEITEPALGHDDATMPGRAPATRLIDQGYQLLTETRYDAAEDILDALRMNCQEMGIPVRSMETEMGPSQFEFTFEPGDAMTQACNLVMFRTMAKEVCARNGLHATFMTRPALPNTASSGWHVHQSLLDAKSGKNLFIPAKGGGLSTPAQGWIAGLLELAAETCLLTTPTVNGYKRHQPHQLAPDRIAWGNDNKGAMIRAILSPDDPASRIENRLPESAANPFFCLAAQIVAGLHGIGNKLQPPPPSEKPYEETADRLPETLRDAIGAFAASDVMRSAFGEPFVDWLVQLKLAEWNRYRLSVSQWEQDEYFSLF